MNALRAAIRYESARIRSVRSTWALIGTGVALNALIALALAREVRNGDRMLSDPDTVAGLLTGAGGYAPACFVALIAGLLGIIATGSESRHGQNVGTLLAIPRRGVLLSARALVLSAWAGLLAVASLAAAYGVAALTLNGSWSADLVRAGDVPLALAGFVLLVAATALLGAALAEVFRRRVPAALALLVLPLVLEPTVLWMLAEQGSSLAGAANWLPFTAGQQLIDLPGGEGPGYGLLAADTAGSAAAFPAMLAAATVAAGALFIRRDA